ncbi:hypothetical protein Nepgr_015557 [Nepenthes gracilis]|uniref:Uncharacterized protein n=1 Tax=Nepenthes gracilis TaxID=150966 RepID=A0AAD3SNR5_NEPGR|nr:hypothetical protein Nepgr_015557 [Nepenthes gracilis]
MVKREEKEGGMVLDGIIDGMPLYAKELIAGGVAGGVAKTAVAPLERVKILFQTRKEEFKAVGLLGSFMKIAKTEGLLGFYRGNGASVARIVPYAALHYMTYEQYRRWIIQAFPNVWKGPVLDLVAGSFAGGTAVILTYPLDLVRTKLAYQVFGSAKSNVKGLINSERVYKGIFDCFSKTYKEAGFRGLYRGVAPSLYGIFPYAGLKFYLYEEMKRHVPEEQKKDVTMKLVCGSVAGLFGQTFTYPLDVVRRQMQVQQISNASNMKGTLETLATIAKEQGWKQLFSGLSLNYLRVVPSVAIGFTVYDTMKSHLQIPSREEAVIGLVTDGKNSQPSSLHS